MTQAAIDLLHGWLARQLPDASAFWLDDQLAKLGSDPADRELHIALGMVPRRLGKDDLALGAEDLEAAGTARDGWDPRGWSVDVAARVLVLCRAGGSGAAFAKRFTDLCRSADVAESIAFYCGLPLYRSPELLETQAAEGLRPNMRAGFEAIAHRNPFPRERFEENRWNHMVLKALFIDSTLAPIQGLDERANPELARILCDYAHERWAAGRPITPELWRCVGPFARGDALADLERVLTTGGETERKAAVLALTANPAPAARDLAARAGELTAAIASGELTWQTVTRDS